MELTKEASNLHLTVRAPFSHELKIDQSVAHNGACLTVVAIGAGWVLSAAGEALCFIPNEIGASLLYNEPITR